MNLTQRISLAILSLVAGMLLMSESALAQSCCSVPAHRAFAENEHAMYTSAGFASLHAAPLPFTYKPERGSMIRYATASGDSAQAFFIPAAKPTNKYLIVIHEWWGLNDYIKQEAERWQKQLGNVNVMALDLFDGQIATTPEEAQKLTTGLQQDRARAIIQGALDRAGSNAKIATIGWCFGGGWALQTSLMAGKRGEATVMYYGMPEFDVKKLESLHGPVIEFFGSQDQYINKEKEDQFKSAMAQAHRSLETHTYNAVHAFANPSNPKYDKEAAADANKRALAFLKKHFT